MPLRACRRKSLLERSERRDCSWIIVGVIGGDADQVSDTGILSAAECFEFADSLARFARVNQGARRRDRLVNLTIA